ncbi:signal peptidase I [Curtobacterium sp. Leaf261]|uniref:signal peptidase I n=1 Tax=Curtobacterium sp. Leaf261 TaxID=1736311 RepID=UPI0006F53302|nr:signal peptidase I [Curtobacterium sp. Leaf261]KQO64140.1 S26 family signal peptidase [Curtobacterium sp. Leaf261]
MTQTISTTGRQRRAKGTVRFLRDLLVIVLVALLVSFLVKAYVIRSFWIPSGSMMNTLQVQDHVIVDELVPTMIKPRHGDVVVFKDPGGWLRPVGSPAPSGTGRTTVGTVIGAALGSSDKDDHLVKRVIGLPGDHVACCNDFGQMTINGIPVKEPYLDLPPGESAASKVPFSVTVPAHSLWVMGDNRDNSEDSRFHQNLPSHGFVPYADVTGRAVVISWPLGRWQWLDDYQQVFADVEQRQHDA